MAEKIRFDTIGGRIKYIREKILKLNQLDFAQELGFESPTAISRYEKGQREPDIKTILKIAELGKKSVDWLLTGETPTGAAPAHPPDIQEYVDRLVAILERGGGPAEYVKGVIDSKYQQECREPTADCAAEGAPLTKPQKKGA